MKKTILLTFSIFIALNGFSQDEARNIKLKETETLNIQKQKPLKSLEKIKRPQVLHTYKVRPKQINLLTYKVNSLTNGNAYLTELVIKELKHTNKESKDIISDVEYSILNAEKKKQCVKESEVLEIIKTLKVN